jgi:hypothetical protein
LLGDGNTGGVCDVEWRGDAGGVRDVIGAKQARLTIHVMIRFWFVLASPLRHRIMDHIATSGRW